MTSIKDAYLIGKPDTAAHPIPVPFEDEVYIKRYLFGQFWSLIGTNLQTASLSMMIVMILGKTQGLSVCGDVAAYGYTPGIFLAIIVGAWLDVVDKRQVLLWCTWLGGLQALVMAIHALDNGHHITIPEIRILAIVLGFITAVDSVNRNAIMAPMLYNQDNYAKTGLIFTSLYNFSMIFGGGTAAILVKHFGYSGSYVLNALSYLVLILQITRIILPRQKLDPRLGPGLHFDKIAWDKVKDGIRFCWHDTGLRLSIILTGLICTFSFSYNSILRIVAEEMFGGTDEFYSHLMTAGGIGSLAGALVAIKIGRLYPKQLVVTGGFICGTSLILFSRAHDQTIGLILMGCVGFGFMSSLSTTRAAVGNIAGPVYAGRAQGLAITMFFLGIAGGSSGLAHFSKHFGCPLGLLICGIVTAVISVCVPFMPGADEIHRN